ncbi:hypothetical protein Tco_1252232 [Tanacetum coccineum]
MFKPIIDAYDSDWMKAPMAAVAFMANLSSTRAHQHQVNEGMLIPLHPLTMPLEYGILNRSWYHQVVSMKKKNEKPGHVRPANGSMTSLILKFCSSTGTVSVNRRIVIPPMNVLVKLVTQIVLYGYCKNLKKTVKTRQSRTWERKREYKSRENAIKGQQKSTHGQ